jgi:hypothetical protein
VTTPTRVILVTTQHFVRGAIVPDGRRLLDLFNDSRSEYLRVVGCTLSGVADPGRDIGQFERGIIPKAIVDLAVLPDRHEAPRKRATMAVRKHPFAVFFTIGGCHVRGVIHLERHYDAVDLLVKLRNEGTTFFPITDVELSPDGPPVIPFTAPAALVSVARLGFFHLADPPPRADGLPRTLTTTP